MPFCRSFAPWVLAQCCFPPGYPFQSCTEFPILVILMAPWLFCMSQPLPTKLVTIAHAERFGNVRGYRGINIHQVQMPRVTRMYIYTLWRGHVMRGKHAHQELTFIVLAQQPAGSSCAGRISNNMLSPSRCSNGRTHISSGWHAFSASWTGA